MDWLRKQWRSVRKRGRPVLVGALTGGPVGAVGGLFAGADIPEEATELMQPVIDAVLAGQVTTSQAVLAGLLALLGTLAGGFAGYVVGTDADTD